jgi:prevent-host-death family protein
MKDIGIRELKSQASHLVRQVAEDRATYTITRRGRPVGILAPADFAPAAARGTPDAAWAHLLALAGQLAAAPRGRKSALKALAEMRR